MSDEIEQIIIEQCADADGGGWAWDAFGLHNKIASGQAPTLTACLDSMNEYLRADGHLSLNDLPKE